MKINEDELTIHVSLDDSDFNAAIDEYKYNRALLNVEKDRAPELFIDGESYPVVQLSYQFITKTASSNGINIVIAEYFDDDKVKQIIFDNNTGKISSGNEYYLGNCGDDVKAIDELVKRGFTKQQALEAYQCLCNLS
ncbi:hypothetical protein [Pediococcus pentosaceus]|uniref:hypothetical protein n=1 Tax=Pediococcus pentosaceus TaxID=1255 RepID=UPI0021A636BC|nr:hypothetical protein [Pediococcus pentosaceus]MCT3021234.1 hypothetical protein [Pediococcus pentosaceus]MDY8106069.1 hypothetical protein [Pediococcus pentosaceus]